MRKGAFYISIAVLILSCGLILGQDKPKVTLANGQAGPVAPKLTEAQKLELRTAQVEQMQAMQDLQQTPGWKAYQDANKRLTDALLKIYKETGLDPGVYTLDK